MEISFWRYLYKEHPGLPLKQRIPEVAIFHGHVLQDCYYSNQRGLLQKRQGPEVTPEALLDRLLALASKRTDGADLSPDTPAAILRRPPPASSCAPHVATVLSTSELMDLLKEPHSPRSVVGDFSEEWSLQSIVVPAEDLRTVAVYSRGPLREERIDVIGRSYQAMYQVGDSQGTRPGSASSTNSTALAAVPEAQAMKVEAKAQALVQYVQHFHQRAVEGLLAEFVQDTSGRIILQTFWKITFADPSVRPILPDSMLADGTGQAFTSTGSASALLRSSQNESSIASTALPTTVSAEATLAGQSCSTTDGFGSTSRPTSATLSRPTSASRERPGSAKGSRPGSAGGPRRPNNQFAEDPQQDIQILEDDDVGGDDDIDAEIERLQAARRPCQMQQQRSGNRPTHAGRPEQSTSGARSAQNGQVRLLLELWDGGHFLGEALLQPSTNKNAGEPEVLELGRPKSIRVDVRKEVPMQDGAGLSACSACRLSVATTWDQRLDAQGALRLCLLGAEIAVRPECTAPMERHVRAQLWSCCPQVDGFECRPLWSSKDALQAPASNPAGVLLFEWPEETIDVTIPAVPAATPGAKKRPFSARARIGPSDDSADGPTKMRPASARLSGRRTGSTERLAQDQKSYSRPWSANSAPKQPSQPSSGRPRRPSSARKPKPAPAAAKSKPQRPQSARSARSPEGSRTRPATDAVRKKQTLHSQQLLSRYQMERDARTRLISILVRQLERNRDMMPTWVEQRNAIRIVVGRAEEQAGERRGEVDRLLAEREQIEKFYLQKLDAAVQCLSQEQEKGKAKVEAKKRELEQSLDMEHETTQELMREERRNDELRVMLDQTVTQLENAQEDLQSLHAQAEFMEAFTASAQYGVSGSREFPEGPSGEGDVNLPGGGIGGAGGGGGPLPTGGGAPPRGGNLPGGGISGAGAGGGPRSAGGAASPRVNIPLRGAFPEASLMHARARMEAHLKEKEQSSAERDATKAGILQAKEDLEQQREQALKLEDFVRKMMHQGSASTGYLLDPVMKREAAAIITSSQKLQAARLQRPISPARRTQAQSDVGEAFYGRRCAACDEYDMRWPPASVGIDSRHTCA